MIENASTHDDGIRAVADAQRVQRFLQELWPEGIPDDAEFVVFDAISVRWQRFRDLAAAAVVLALGIFSYFSCALVRAGTPGRGTAAHAMAIPGLWFDLDIKGGRHAEQSLPTLDEALAFLTLLPVAPSLIIHSGGGLYVWWLFREPWVLDSDLERARAANIVSGWQRYVIASAIKWNWKLDDTSPLSQVLRAEGCLNNKYLPPRLVHRIHNSEARWNPSDFELWIPPAEPARTRSASSQCGTDEFPEAAVRDALSCISPDTDHFEWILMGLSLHSTGAGAVAFECWNDWSARATRICGSSNRHVYPGRDALWQMWSKFGQRREGQKLVGLGTLVHRARACGWKGSLPRPRSQQLEEVEPLSPIEATRPLVHNIDEAARVARDVASDWTPGAQSLHFHGAPGLGKTTAFGEIACLRLVSGDWKCGLAVLALPSRDLVQEKVAKLRAYAHAHGLSIQVRELLGRSPEQDSGWYCERYERVQQQAELRRPACIGCPLYGDGPKVLFPKQRGRCAVERGRYWHSCVPALKPGALVVATCDSIRCAWSEIPEDSPLMLDDVGPTLGLVHPRELRLADIDSALDNVDAWRTDGQVAPALMVEEQATELVRAVLGALRTRGRLRTSLVEDAVRALPEETRQAIIADTIKAPREGRRPRPWRWELVQEEDGLDDRPAFTELALAVAREVLVHGSAPLVERTERSARDRGAAELRIHLPDRELIQRARNGYVAWLSVAPAPISVLDQLGARREVVRAAPTALRLIIGELRVESQDGKHERVVAFGPGKRKGEGVSPEDTVVRAVAKACAEAREIGSLAFEGERIESFGAVLQKVDREALGSPEWCRSFGAGHAGSDALQDAELLLVRRFVPPYASLAMDAAILRRTLNLEGEKLPAPARKLAKRREQRRWTTASEPLATCVPADSLERELLQAAEAHGMANALGRSRALSADGRRIVLVLCGRPFDVGGKEPEVRPLRDVLASLGILDLVQLPTLDERRAALARANAAKAERQAELRERISTELARTTGASVQTLARRLHAGPRTIRARLAEIRAVETAGLPSAFEQLRAALRGQIGSTSDRDISIQRRADLSAFPSAVEIRDEIEAATGCWRDHRTVRRRRSELVESLKAGAEILIPKRSDAAKTLLEVTRAALVLVARQVSAGEPGLHPAGGGGAS